MECFTLRISKDPRRKRDEKARLRDVEQELLKCQRMVERGLDANHLMIREFIHEQKGESDKIWEAIDRSPRQS